MAIAVSTNFNLGASLPLDSRAVAGSFSDLANIETKYVGMHVYVTNEGAEYTYTGAAWVNTQKTHYALDLTGAADDTIADYGLILGSFPGANQTSGTNIPRIITIIGTHDLSSAVCSIVTEGYDAAPAVGTMFSIENYSSGTIYIGGTLTGGEPDYSIPVGETLVLKWTGTEMQENARYRSLTHAEYTKLTSLLSSSLGGYSVGGTGENGEAWGYIPIVKTSDGGMELGQYIDFHIESDDGIDRTARIRIYDDSGTPRFKLEGSSSGSLAHLTVKNLSAEQYHGTYYGTFGYPAEITLNGTTYTYNGNSASAEAFATGLVFFAPTSAGTEGYLLLADENGQPTWTDVMPYTTKFQTGASGTSISISAFYSAFTSALSSLQTAISSGDEATLASAKEYADEKLASVTPYQGTVSSQDDFQAILIAQEWKKGWCWKVAKAMDARVLYYTAPALEVGDLILAESDAPGTDGMTVYSDSTVVISNYFTVLQTNLDGAVTTETKSSTANNIVVFSNETGQVIKDSGISMDDLATNADLTYTNENGTTAAVGGIAAGTTFEDESVVSILENLLYPMAISFKATANGAGTYEKGVTVSPTFTITVTQGASEVESVGIYSGTTLVESTAAAQAGTQTGVTLTNALSATTTLKATAAGGKQSVTSSSLTWTFIDAMYYGAVSSAPDSSDAVTALTKLVKSKAAQTVSFTTTSSAGKYCFCYPASYGALSSILDGNGFDNTSDFIQSTVTVTTTAGESVSYYVYTYNNSVTAGTMSFTFKW